MKTGETLKKWSHQKVGRKTTRGREGGEKTIRIRGCFGENKREAIEGIRLAFWGRNPGRDEAKKKGGNEYRIVKSLFKQKDKIEWNEH